MKFWLFFALQLTTLLPLSSRGQVLLQDDFSDGNFSENPAWLGEEEKFAVLNQQLQLYDQQAGSSNTAFLSLFAPVSMNDSTCWQFQIKLDFAPSTANHARVYLMASEADLSSEQLHGYYLKIGGISGTDDALQLYRQDGNQHALLLQGSPGSVGQQPAMAQVKISRNQQGLWQVRTDYTGGNNWQFEGEVYDSTYQQSNYFGWLCKYTSTRNEHFFFDDLQITPIYQDTLPPKLLEATSIAPNLLRVTFDESLDETSASEPNNYLINPNLGHPTEAFLDTEDRRVVFLQLSDTMQHLHSYSLSANAIRDEYGNTSNQQLIHFTHYNWPQAAAYELLFTEIMADPKPAVALPEAEYLELYNNSNQTIQLEGYQLEIGNKTASLPACLLEADSLLILCDEEDAGLFSVYGRVLALPSMPALTNSGTRLVLRNRNGEVVHALAYEDSWYANNYKDEGGWSLAMRNPLAACRDKENWGASEDLRGGSPGQRNAVFQAKADTSPTRLLSAYPLNEQQIRLTFNKRPEADCATTHTLYSIEPALSIDSIHPSGEQSRAFIVFTSEKMQNGTQYTLHLQSGLCDCLGHETTESQSVRFGLPQIAAPGEVIINELLYEPQTGGKDFIELLNTSDKIFDLSNFLLANSYQGSDSIHAIYVEQLLLPGQLVVLTPSPEDIRARYATPQPEALFENALPSFAPPEGEAVLFYRNPQGQLTEVERFPYSDALHNPLIGESRGISLERISPLEPATSAQNWSSAAQQAGGATPTGENSQRVIFAERQSNNPNKSSNFYTEYELFSPDGDGHRDLLPIRYHIKQAGASINLLTFDMQGRLCKQLALLETAATEGVIFWAGDDDRGNRLPPGTYLLWIACMFPDGTTEYHKLSCSLVY